MRHHSTLPQINELLRHHVPGVKLHKGEGYFYFEGDMFNKLPTTSVMVFRLNQLSPAQWIAEARGFVKAASDAA